MGRGDGDETEGAGDPTVAEAAPLDLDDDMFGTPSCPGCIRSMTPASTPSGGVYWACVHCGQSRLA